MQNLDICVDHFDTGCSLKTQFIDYCEYHYCLSCFCLSDVCRHTTFNRAIRYATRQHSAITNNIVIAEFCQYQFGFEKPSVLWKNVSINLIIDYTVAVVMHCWSYSSARHKFPDNDDDNNNKDDDDNDDDDDDDDDESLIQVRMRSAKLHRHYRY